MEVGGRSAGRQETDVMSTRPVSGICSDRQTRRIGDSLDSLVISEPNKMFANTRPH